MVRLREMTDAEFSKYSALSFETFAIEMAKASKKPLEDARKRGTPFGLIRLGSARSMMLLSRNMGMGYEFILLKERIIKTLLSLFLPMKLASIIVLIVIQNRTTKIISIIPRLFFIQMIKF